MAARPAYHTANDVRSYVHARPSRPSIILEYTIRVNSSVPASRSRDLVQRPRTFQTTLTSSTPECPNVKSHRINVCLNESKKATPSSHTKPRQSSGVSLTETSSPGSVCLSVQQDIFRSATTLLHTSFIDAQSVPRSSRPLNALHCLFEREIDHHPMDPRVPCPAHLPNLPCRTKSVLSAIRAGMLGEMASWQGQL